jgi:hypothetical protein
VNDADLDEASVGRFIDKGSIETLRPASILAAKTVSSTHLHSMGRFLSDR